MKPIILMLGAALYVHAQATVLAKPMLPKAAYGKFQVTQISVKSEASTAQTFSREAIMQLFPEIGDLPDGYAEDAINGRVAEQPLSFVGLFWKIISPLAATALSGLAIAQRQNGPIYIAGGITLANMIVALLQTNAINPSKYYNQLLPAQVTVPGFGGATYYVVSYFSKGAGPVGPVRISAAGDTATDQSSVNTHALDLIMKAHAAGLKAYEETWSLK